MTRRDPEVSLDFERLFKREYCRLVTACLFTGIGREAAEDAVQEAFAAALARWAEIGRLDDPAGWVRRVALYKAIDRVRSSRREPGFLRRLASQPSTRRDPDAVRWNDLEDEIRRLPPRQRAAVLLYYVEDLPVDEVAGILESATGTIKSNLHDARRRLATAWGGSP